MSVKTTNYRCPICNTDNGNGEYKICCLQITFLANEQCAVCAGSVDHDGYGECEGCGHFYCADHNDLVKGICPECMKLAQEESFNHLRGVA